MKLVLEDFMTKMKEQEEQMVSMRSKYSSLEERFSEEHKLRKSAEHRIVSAACHTLISICRMNGTSAQNYLKTLFREIVKGRRDYENLLPMTIGISVDNL